jgi:STE24 endopeptidase
MNWFTGVFIAALMLATGIRLWLARRQIRHVAAHRDRVPDSFATRISPGQHRKAADYTLAGTRFEIAGVLAHAALLLAWTLGGGIHAVDALWRGLATDPYVTGAGVIFSVLFVNTLLTLPLSVWRVFVIEQRFGFNHTRPALFVTDLVKSGLLTLLIGLPLVTIVLMLMGPGDPLAAQTQPLWWLFAWLAWLGFMLLMTWAWPAFIAPWFNRFVPLDHAELKRRIDALLARTGFSSNGVFVMDGSRRSAHGNAYFTGLGANKRIVFFDTLLDALSPAEIEAVLAHELGHFRRRHVHKRLAKSALFGLAGLLLLDWLLGHAWFYSGLGLEAASHHGALLLFAFAGPVFGFIITPLVMHVSRRQEYEADDFAAEQANAGDLVNALVKLYRDNASTLTPDPLYSAFHHSHPPAAARIAHLQHAAERP